jgi:hypothetical protein
MIEILVDRGTGQGFVVLCQATSPDYWIPPYRPA